MKTSIKGLFTAILIIQGLSLKAQSTTGVYLNENDYKDHKLTYASNTDKLQLNEFFGGSSISVISEGKKVNLNKSEIFGYRLANQDYRFYNNIAYKVIDLTIEGLDESKEVMIISDKHEEITEVLMARLGRGVTLLQGKGGYTGEEKGILYCVVTRLEVSKFKSIINEIDEEAFVTISSVHEVMGGRFKKKAIH